MKQVSNLEDLVEQAIAEDLPEGDLNTDLLRADQREVRARILAKEDLVLCGQEAANLCFQRLGAKIQIKWQFNDGDLVLDRQTICTLSGPISEILKAERVALNFLGFMSGIATLTRCYVKKVESTNCKILDTRKTRPGHREIEKYAVKVGGAENHRMNLSEAILVKENHIAAYGDLKTTLEVIRQHTKLPIEVEVKNLKELEVAVEQKVGRVLLDNMSLDDTYEAVRLTPPQIEIEASGNMNLDRVEEVAKSGVHFISVGAITHSAPCADLSLIVQPVE